MTGLDTNVLLRYLVQDDEAQLRAVLNLLLRKGGDIFCSRLGAGRTRLGAKLNLSLDSG